MNETVFKSKNFTFAILSERENRGSLGVVIWQYFFSAKLKEVFWHQTAGEVSEPLLSHLSEKLPDVPTNTDDSCLYY